MKYLTLFSAELQTLRLAQYILAEEGVAPTTKLTRAAQNRRYKKFCKKFNLSLYPCSAPQAGLYATYLAEDNFAPVSVRNYVSAVWYQQKMLGFKDFSDDFVLRQTLNGIERSFNNPDKLGRYPFSPADILGIRAGLDLTVHNDIIFWIAVILGYRCLLRICHVTLSQHNIGVGSLSLMEGYILIRIRTSKTDQFGRQEFSVFLQDIPGSPWCIRKFIEDILSVSIPTDPLLCHKVGKIVFPLTYDEVYSRLKYFAIKLGLPEDRVSTHSLRHGGSTLLRDLGVPVESIMQRGNWRSSVVRRYLHQSVTQFTALELTPCTYFSSF